MFLFAYNKSMSQISIGGLPLTLQYKTSYNDLKTISIDKPDMQKLMLEDELSNKAGAPYRMGLNIPVGKGIHNSGTWTTLANGDKVWRLRLMAKDAQAIGVYYDKLYIPKGGRLFLYNNNYNKILGAYTSINNSPSGVFATELTGGESVILEYDQLANVTEEAIINISEINYAYRSANSFGGSGACEVNVNCSEGDNWKPQQHGVVRISIKLNGGSYWCTGSVVNNVRKDYKPYVLTADHCAQGATLTDLSQWIFYFNYEAPSCTDPIYEGSLATKSMTGATRLAEGGNSGNTGSDFYLVILNNNIPESYNPYFIGWDRQNIPGNSGVSIHHPEGDIKKISTYGTPLVSSDWNSHTIQTHWQVYWDPTANGYGVTEGGSSGSPIFNENGKLIGTLTGGDSYCGNLTGADYYGKFYYHWNLNDSTASGRLKDWLDPDTTGVSTLNGMYYASFDFVADKTIIPVGSTVNFTDVSTGGPYAYQWKFVGATPDTSNDQNPTDILYTTCGSYAVTMRVANTDTAYQKIKSNYIMVYDEVKFYPNPADDYVWLDLQYNNFTKVKISIYNMFGMLVRTIERPLTDEKKILIDTSWLSSGMYIFKIEGDTRVSQKKVIVIHK